MQRIIFDEIEKTAAYLKLNISAQEVADVMLRYKYDDDKAQAISEFLLYLKDKRHDNLVNILVKICICLECKIDDILDIIPEDN